MNKIKNGKMHESLITSTNGKDILHTVIWEPEEEIKAIVQISHGMKEYIKRYAGFAGFLNMYGILVVGNDHLGHGETAEEGNLGYFGPGLSETVVADMHEVTDCTKSAYGKNIPYFLFGHSMGSFLARRYMMTYGDELDGAIISGTGYQSPVRLAFGKTVTSFLDLVHGDRYQSEFLRRICFGSYNRRIEKAESENDWLSRDREVVQKYNNDKYCTFNFTVNGYQTLFDVLFFIQRNSNIIKIPKKLPVFLIAGEEDPVGDYGRGVIKVCNSMKKAGITQVELELYGGDRHELLNETDRDQIYSDIVNWIFRQINRRKG